MDINFPLVLVVATAFTGGVWLIDRLFFASARRALATGGVMQTGAEQSEIVEEEPKLVEYSRSFFPVLAVVLILRSFVVEPFQIPSGSMIPTLEVGDFILVNKFAYGIRLPVTDTKILDIGKPQRGDVMVFRYPIDGKTNYIKRVIGLPGDAIHYDKREKMLYINGEPISRTPIDEDLKYQTYQEHLGGVDHLIAITKGTHTVQPTQTDWVIPEGEYFMMGDNRDNSNDSRFWGTVPDKFIVGKAFAIWMHWAPLLSIPSFSRVGSIQ